MSFNRLWSQVNCRNDLKLTMCLPVATNFNRGSIFKLVVKVIYYEVVLDFKFVEAEDLEPSVQYV